MGQRGFNVGGQEGIVYWYGNEELLFVPGYSSNGTSGSGSGEEIKNPTDLRLNAYQPFTDQNTQRTFVTDVPINLTGKSEVGIIGSLSGVSGASRTFGYVCVSTIKMGASNQYNARAELLYNAGIGFSRTSVSSLNGNYYIRLHVVAYGATNTASLIAYAIWAR